MDKQNIKAITKIVLCAVILYCILQNINIVFTLTNNVFTIVYPFILGAGIAFILNIPMSFCEKKIFKQKKNKRKAGKNKIKRLISMLISIITVVIILTIIISLVIPELINILKLLIDNIPNYIETTENFLMELTDKYPELNDIAQNIRIDEEKLQKSLINLTGNVMTFSINTVKGLVSGIVNTFISIVFAIYILSNKEKLKMQIKKLAYAYLPKEKAEKFIKVSRLSKQTLKNFISGQVIEAIILGVLCAIGMTILKIPYAVTISVLMAFTALIPIIGAFLGAFIGVLLIVTINPMKALIFIIFILILQQIEGNLIYPKVVGKTIGLPGMWVLFAITVGGGFFGIIGMLLGVPIISVLYTLVKESVNERIDKEAEILS